MNTEQIGIGYREWFYSSPFDIGQTTLSAFQPLKDAMVEAEFTKSIYATVEEFNQESASNGSLMRCTPLAVWGSDLSVEDLQKASDADVSFTHSHVIVKRAVFAYHLGIKYLLNNPLEKDRARKAFEFVKEISKGFEETIDNGSYK